MNRPRDVPAVPVRADGAGADLGSRFDFGCPAGRQLRSRSATRLSRKAVRNSLFR